MCDWRWSCGVGLLLGLMGVVPQVSAEDTVAVPSEVKALVGTFTGSWTLFGLDAKGDIAKRMSWTDTMTAQEPQVKGGRAFVKTVDEMAFDGRPGKPFQVTGTEGYLLEANGKLGDYFIESFGRVQRMVKLSDKVWTYAAPAAPQELTQLGFPSGATGQHVLVKVITQEQGVETHRISRVSTVSWKTPEGQERVVQFVSLQGFHRRK